MKTQMFYITTSTLLTIAIHAALISGGMLATTTVSARGDDNGDYYPSYTPRHHRRRHYNPTVRRDYYSEDGYASDGTYHSKDTTEDRRASYYSPGRNQAITRPRTTTESWRNEYGEEVTREQTSWIGADNRPHSTTVENTTTTDEDGNSHTDSNVTLKSARRAK